MIGGFFVTGTDTDVGKTWVSCQLVRAFRAKGVDAVGMKPFSCGDRADAEALDLANGGTVEMGLVNPVWLRVPASPYAASLIENRTLDVATAQDAYAVLSKNHRVVVVEGVGGWRVPLTDQMCMSDFAVEMDLPVLVVAANRIGALNHTRLTVEAIQQRGLRVAGILWNEVSAGESDPARMTNRAVFEQLMPGIFQADIAHGSESLDETLLAHLLEML